jgi:catechol 2,3-dioxygenase-like lactoylglutathione lyase family enzyme
MSTQVSTHFTPGHIGLNVRDLMRSKRFYQDVFGFDIAAESNDEGRTSPTGASRSPAPKSGAPACGFF